MPFLYAFCRDRNAVIPAQAGIQSVQFRSFLINSCCFSFLDSHFCGNDGGRGKSSQSKASSFPQKTATRNSNLKPRHSRAGRNPTCPVPVVFRLVTFEPSFPRRRESSPFSFGQFRSFLINSCCFSFLDSHFCGNDGGRGKSSQSKASSFPQKTATRNSNLKPRHSRAGRNPTCPVPVVFRLVTFEPSFPRRRESSPFSFGQFRSFPINSCCFSFLDSHFCGNDGGRGKSSQPKASSFPQKTATRNSNLKPRHSRAGGNLGLSVQELIG